MSAVLTVKRNSILRSVIKILYYYNSCRLTNGGQKAGEKHGRSIGGIADSADRLRGIAVLANERATTSCHERRKASRWWLGSKRGRGVDGG